MSWPTTSGRFAKNKLVFARFDIRLGSKPFTRYWKRLENPEVATTVRGAFSLLRWHPLPRFAAPILVMPSHFHWVFSSTRRVVREKPQGRAINAPPLRCHAEHQRVHRHAAAINLRPLSWRGNSGKMGPGITWVRGDDELERIICYIEDNSGKSRPGQESGGLALVVGARSGRNGPLSLGQPYLQQMSRPVQRGRSSSSRWPDNPQAARSQAAKPGPAKQPGWKAWPHQKSNLENRTGHPLAPRNDLPASAWARSGSRSFADLDRAPGRAAQLDEPAEERRRAKGAFTPSTPSPGRDSQPGVSQETQGRTGPAAAGDDEGARSPHRRGAADRSAAVARNPARPVRNDLLAARSHARFCSA